MSGTSGISTPKDVGAPSTAESWPWPPPGCVVRARDASGAVWYGWTIASGDDDGHDVAFLHEGWVPTAEELDRLVPTLAFDSGGGDDVAPTRRRPRPAATPTELRIHVTHKAVARAPESTRSSARSYRAVAVLTDNASGAEDVTSYSEILSIRSELADSPTVALYKSVHGVISNAEAEYPGFFGTSGLPVRLLTDYVVIVKHFVHDVVPASREVRSVLSGMRGGRTELGGGRPAATYAFAGATRVEKCKLRIVSELATAESPDDLFAEMITEEVVDDLLDELAVM